MPTLDVTDHLNNYINTMLTITITIDQCKLSVLTANMILIAILIIIFTISFYDQAINMEKDQNLSSY